MACASRRFQRLGQFVALLIALPAQSGSLTGPLLDEGSSATIEDVVQVPASGSSPATRINMLAEAPDGSGRLFVNDLRGVLHVIDGSNVATYLDLNTERPLLTTSPGLATGFVSFAFHPDFALNGRLYTVHTESVGATPPSLQPALAPPSILHHAILSEWTATNPSAGAFSGSSRELIRVASPHFFHNLGEIAFAPDTSPGDDDHGLLYIGGGDYGAVAVGQPEQLQRLDTPLGAILRVDPLGGNGSPYSYGIPDGNPWADDGDPSTLDEIYAYGFRNAHRISWSGDAAGTIFVSDIGQGNIEEVNALVAGANYGWPEREGSFALDPVADPETVFALPPNDASLGFSYPAAQYDHEEGQAVAGGFVYRGIPSSPLYGKFIFGDIASGRLLYADAEEMRASASDGDPATTAIVYELTLMNAEGPTTLLDIVRSATANPGLSRVDLRFGIDRRGGLYVTTKQDGWVRRLTPEAPLPLPGLGTAARGWLVATLLMGGVGFGRALSGAGGGPDREPSCGRPARRFGWLRRRRRG